MSQWYQAVKAPVVMIAGCISPNPVVRWRAYWPKARYHLFDPMPVYANALRAVFALDAQVTVNERALADRAGPLSFHVMTVPYTSSLLPFNEEHAACHPSWREQAAVDVEATTLDAYCAEHGIDRVGFIELDLQGGELAALKGAAGLLGRRAVDALMVEVFYGELYQGVPIEPAVSDYLAGFGYKAADRVITHAGVWGDTIYVRGQA